MYVMRVKRYLCLFWYIFAFYTIKPLSLFFIGKFAIYITRAKVIMPLRHKYICICIDIFVHNIPIHAFIYFCMLYNILIGCTTSWFFVTYILCIGYYTTALWLHLSLKNMLVNIIYMFNAICLFILYNLLLDCTTHLEYCHKYLMYMICYTTSTILVDLHSQ